MSKKRWLIVPLCAVLCSQGLFAQTLDRRVLGIDEMFRLADENSQRIFPTVKLHTSINHSN